MLGNRVWAFYLFDRSTNAKGYEFNIDDKAFEVTREALITEM